MSIEQTFKTLRKEFPVFSSVFDNLEQERKYQEQVWNESTTETKGFHTIPEWFVFIREYLNEAGAHISRNPYPQASIMAANCLRKVAAMVLASIEQHNELDNFIQWIQERTDSVKFEEFTNKDAIQRNIFDVNFDNEEDPFEDGSFVFNSTNELLAYCFGLNQRCLNQYTETLFSGFQHYSDMLFSTLYAYLTAGVYLDNSISRIEYEEYRESLNLPY